MEPDADADEEELLRSVAIKNARSILLARERAEAELRRSVALMRATLESTTDGILVTDEQGGVTHVNENYVALWRLPRVLLESRSHAQIVEVIAKASTSPGSFVARIHEILASSDTFFDTLELVDGRVFERISRVQSAEGRSLGRVWIVRDITEIRRAFETERRARDEAERASAMKDQFLGVLSHELRTPLTAILGWSTMLQRDGVSQEELRRGLSVVARNARDQIRLIEDLLDMTRITAGKMQLDIQLVAPASIVEAALETIRPAAGAKGIRVEAALGPAAGLISGDPTRLQQVVSNLLSNAVKFTETNGRIEVSSRSLEGRIEICVSDNGQGIAPAFLPHVFERFRQADDATTRRVGGLGLGLAIVKELVELHGGSVAAESPGHGLGATFTVRLPLAAT